MAPPEAQTMFDLLSERSRIAPDGIAVIATDGVKTYRTLHAEALRLGQALFHHGVRHGERVGLLCSNRAEWVQVCHGAGAAGAVTVPFSTWSTRDELDFLIRDSGIAALFTLERSGDSAHAADLFALAPELARAGSSRRFPALRSIVVLNIGYSGPFRSLDDYLSAAAGADALPESIKARPDEDGLVLYTSGSSATPKAVRLKQSGIVSNGFHIGERQGLGPKDRVLVSPPLFWSYGSANAMSATLSHGAALVLQERFNPAEAISLIEQHSCTSIYTLPGMTNAILRDPCFSRERVRSLRTGLTIGSAQDVMKAANDLGAAEICNIYGSTETYGNCCVTPHDWPLERRAHCQGPPLPGNELRFTDVETGAVLPPGQQGLVEVRGNVTPGYSGASAALNADSFSPEGYFRMGDVGSLDETGCFVFAGRNSEMIKRAGINISPAEVEDILLRHPSVELAGVVGAPHPEQGEQVIAFVTQKASAALTPAELAAHCRAIASKYKVPDHIVLRTSLPQTATGKLQRRELKQEAARLFSVSGRPAHG